MTAPAVNDGAYGCGEEEKCRRRRYSTAESERLRLVAHLDAVGSGGHAHTANHSIYPEDFRWRAVDGGAPSGKPGVRNHPEARLGENEIGA